MARTRTQFDCNVEGCEKRAWSRSKCSAHLKAWQRKNAHLRCKWRRCGNYQDDGAGRRMGSGRAKLWYCREHEVEHLRPSPEVGELNTVRVAALLKAEGDCWVWEGPSGVKDTYPMFMPEGADKVNWVAYRVLWDLLMGGHKHGYELDHCLCKNPRCCSPAHLEPVSRSENERRKKKPAYRVNWKAAEAPAVVDFAGKYGLPLPAKGARPGGQPHERIAPQSSPALEA